MRANCVAWIHRKAEIRLLSQSPPPWECWMGWRLQWSLDSYPDDVAEMLIDHDGKSSEEELDIIEDDSLDESEEDENNF